MAEIDLGLVTGAQRVELTQAQYDALPASKLSDGVDYRIKDGQQSMKTSSQDVIHGTGTVKEKLMAHDTLIDGLQTSINMQQVELNQEAIPSALGPTFGGAIAKLSENIAKKGQVVNVTFPFTPLRSGLLVVACANGSSGNLVNAYKSNGSIVFTVTSSGAIVSGIGYFNGGVTITKDTLSGSDYQPNEKFIYL